MQRWPKIPAFNLAVFSTLHSGEIMPLPYDFTIASLVSGEDINTDKMDIIIKLASNLKLDIIKNDINDTNKNRFRTKLRVELSRRVFNILQ